MSPDELRELRIASMALDMAVEEVASDPEQTDPYAKATTIQALRRERAEILKRWPPLRAVPTITPAPRAVNLKHGATSMKKPTLSAEAARRIARQIAENSGVVTDLGGVKGAPK